MAACPVGAIAPDGHFDFSACLTHNYREFLGGFVRLGGAGRRQQGRPGLPPPGRRDSRDGLDVAEPRVRAELQGGLLHGGLPGGRGRDRAVPGRPQGGSSSEVVEPAAGEGGAGLRHPRLGRRGVCRRSGSRTRGPGGWAAVVGPQSIRSFLATLPHVFQRHASEGLDATYHFTFTGEEPAEATVVIRDKTIRVEEGHAGTPDLRITADSRTWLGFLAKERSLVWALLRRKIRLKGSPRLLLAFGRCFPS